MGVRNAVVYAAELALRVVGEAVTVEAGEVACRVVLEAARSGQSSRRRSAGQLVVGVVGANARVLRLNSAGDERIPVFRRDGYAVDYGSNGVGVG